MASSIMLRVLPMFVKRRALRIAFFPVVLWRIGLLPLSVAAIMLRWIVALFAIEGVIKSVVLCYVPQ